MQKTSKRSQPSPIARKNSKGIVDSNAASKSHQDSKKCQYPANANPCGRKQHYGNKANQHVQKTMGKMINMHHQKTKSPLLTARKSNSYSDPINLSDSSTSSHRTSNSYVKLAKLSSPSKPTFRNRSSSSFSQLLAQESGGAKPKYADLFAGSANSPAPSSLPLPPAHWYSANNTANSTADSDDQQPLPNTDNINILNQLFANLGKNTHQDKNSVPDRMKQQRNTTKKYKKNNEMLHANVQDFFASFQSPSQPAFSKLIIPTSA